MAGTSTPSATLGIGANFDAEFQVSREPTASQPTVDVALDSTGTFAIVSSTDSRGALPENAYVSGRSYAGDGSAVGEPFQIGSEGGYNGEPHASIGADGNATVSWSRYDGSAFDVHARRLLPAGVTVQAIANPGQVSGIAGARGAPRADQ